MTSILSIELVARETNEAATLARLRFGDSTSETVLEAQQGTMILSPC
jgi:hypothetical protein